MLFRALVASCIILTCTARRAERDARDARVLWSQSLGATPLQAALVIPTFDGTNPIVVTSAFNVSGFDLLTGDLRWTSPLQTAASVTNLAAVPRSPPGAPGFDIVLFFGGGPNFNYIASIRSEDGTVRWMHYFNSDDVGLYCSILVVDGTLMYGNVSQLTGLSTSTGRVLWSVPHASCYWAATVDRHFLALYSDSSNQGMPVLASISLDGSFRWLRRDVNAVPQGVGNPAYLAHSTIVTTHVGFERRFLRAFHLNSGIESWNRTLGNFSLITEYPIGFENTIYFYNDSSDVDIKHIVAVDCTTGTSRWRLPISQDTVIRLGYHATPKVAGSIVLVQQGDWAAAFHNTTLLFNLTTLGQLIDDMYSPIVPWHVPGALHLSSKRSLKNGADQYLATAVHDMSGDVIWQLPLAGKILGITTEDVTGSPLSVAVVVALNGFAYTVST